MRSCIVVPGAGTGLVQRYRALQTVAQQGMQPCQDPKPPQCGRQSAGLSAQWSCLAGAVLVVVKAVGAATQEGIPTVSNVPSPPSRALQADGRRSFTRHMSPRTPIKKVELESCGAEERTSRGGGFVAIAMKEDKSVAATEVESEHVA
eukprot:Sspe_Gene.43980::Locus_21525_Transcript_1_1_Confidence_1.000_Length_499::g.43980::m.43980